MRITAFVGLCVLWTAIGPSHSASAVGADVYKCVSATGAVSYSDSPCAPNASRVEVLAGPQASAAAGPQIQAAAYISPRNRRAIDVTRQLQATCANTPGSCALRCGNQLGGDPDFGTKKICIVIYACADGKKQELRIAEGASLGLSCTGRTDTFSSGKDQVALGHDATLANRTAPVMPRAATASEVGAHTLPAVGNSVPCLSLHQLYKNDRSAVLLWNAVRSCVKEGNYGLAAELFGLFEADIRFDATRVSSPSARAAGTTLTAFLLEGYPGEQREKFNDAVTALFNGEGRGSFCAEIRRIGFPSYFPDYMINHSMESLLNQPTTNGGIVKAFDPAMTWTELESTYLNCSGSTAPFIAPTTGRAATRIAQFTSPDYVGAISFNADGSRLAVNSMVEGHDVYVWDWRANKLVLTLDKGGNSDDGPSICYSPDGRLLAVRHGWYRDHREIIRIWDAQTGAIVRDIADENGWPGGPGALAFQSDGHLLFRAVPRQRGDGGESFIAYRTDTGTEAWGLTTTPFQSAILGGVMAMAPDGQSIALGGDVLSGDGADIQAVIEIAVIDLRARKLARTIKVPRLISAIAWSPNGKYLAVGGMGSQDKPGDYALRIIDAVTGRVVNSIVGKDATVRAIVYSSNGKYLVVAGVEGRDVRIFDAATLELLQVLPGSENALAISRDSRYLAVSREYQVSVWELK